MKGGQFYPGGGKKKDKRNGRSRSGSRRHCKQHGGDGLEGAGGSADAPGSLEFKGGVDSDFVGQVGNGIGAGGHLGAGLGAKVGPLSASAAGAAAVGAGLGADDKHTDTDTMVISPGGQVGGMRHRRRRSVKRRSPKRKSPKRKSPKRKTVKRRSPKRK